MVLKKKKGEKGVRMQCPHCETVVDRKSLRRHVREIHEKIKDFKCDICDAEFFQRPQLLNHMAKNHEQTLMIGHEEGNNSEVTSNFSSKRSKNPPLAMRSDISTIQCAKLSLIHI